jgi:predicted peptidase
MIQLARSFEGHDPGQISLRYLLYLPPGYGSVPEMGWPLMLFLHGIGERGDDLELVKRHGIPRILETGEDLPFVAVSPQCPDGAWWTELVESLDGLLDHVLAQHAVDRDRVYLTGLSMGGYGAWALAIAHPERFAALAPVCGGGDPSQVCALKDVPVWAFHGARDPVVPVRASQEMVDALRACGGDARLTVYPEAGHDSWTQTYDDPRLYEWFLARRRRR